MTATSQATTDTLAQMADELATINASLEHLQQRKGQIEDAIRSLVQPGTKNLPAGRYSLTVAHPQRRLNATLIAREYPVLEFPGLYKPAIDTAAVKRTISDVELEQRGLYTLTTPSVKVA